jgi:hypothetical protein
MVVPSNPKAEQNPRRLIVMAEKHKSPQKRLQTPGCQERQISSKSAAKFDCLRRGGTGKSF